MDSKNWALLLIVVGAIGFFTYSIYNNPDSSVNPIETSDPTPTSQVAGEEFVMPDNWEEFSGETITFSYPPEWEPAEREPFGGSVIEDIELNIPEATDNYVFYSATPYDSIKPDDISIERTLDINNREWIEWIREAEGYVSYDFFTKEDIEGDAGSFGIHVTLPEKNDEIEKKLIDLIHTIEFGGVEENPVEAVTPTQEPTVSEDLP